jgi:hypothetical protein
MIGLIGVNVSKKSAVFLAENVVMVENGSSAFKRGAVDLLETLIPSKQHGVAFQNTANYKYINNHKSLIFIINVGVSIL